MFSPRLFAPALAAACLAAFTPARGQDLNGSARLAGAAFSNCATVDGVDAIGVNPALLTLPKGRFLSIAVLPVSLNMGTDFFSYESYKKYFTGIPTGGKRAPYYLTSVEKQSIYDAFQGEEGNLHSMFGATLFAASFTTRAGSFAVGMRERIASTAVIPRAFVDFFLFGNPPGKSFDFSGTRMASSWTRDYSISFAHKASFTRFSSPSVSFGGSVKMVHGYGYFGLEKFDSRFSTDPDSFAVNGRAVVHARYAGADWMQESNIFGMKLFPEPVGTGFGLDLGVSADLTRSLRIGLSITDLGSINWNRNAREASADETFEISSAPTDAQFEDIKERLSGIERPIPSFTTSLPVAVTASIAYKIPRFLGGKRPFMLTAALREGLNTAPGNSTIPHVGAGIEYEAVESLSLRLGLGAGGGLAPMLGFGLGFRMDTMTLDLGTTGLDALFASNHYTASFAISGRLDF